MKTYPLLQSQLGVFYDCLKFPQVMQYNIPCITELTDDIDLNRVEQAIQTIFAKRPELRIRFLIDDNGEPRQYVDEAKQLTIVQHQMSETDFRQYAYHGFCRPFDIMGEEPLFRVELISTIWFPTVRAIWYCSRSATCHWPTKGSRCPHRTIAYCRRQRTRRPAWATKNMNAPKR